MSTYQWFPVPGHQCRRFEYQWQTEISCVAHQIVFRGNFASWKSGRQCQRMNPFEYRLLRIRVTHSGCIRRSFETSQDTWSCTWQCNMTSSSTVPKWGNGNRQVWSNTFQWSEALGAIWVSEGVRNVDEFVVSQTFQSNKSSLVWRAGSDREEGLLCQASRLVFQEALSFPTRI